MAACPRPRRERYLRKAARPASSPRSRRFFPNSAPARRPPRLFTLSLERRAILCSRARHSSPNPRPVNLLQPLLPYSAASALCFQQLAASFPKTPGWGAPLCELASCIEAKKRLLVTPLLATLTHSRRVSPFLATLTKTPGMGTPTLPRRASLLPSRAPRGAPILCALNRVRILPVAAGVWGGRSLFS